MFKRELLIFLLTISIMPVFADNNNFDYYDATTNNNYQNQNTNNNSYWNTNSNNNTNWGYDTVNQTQTQNQFETNQYSREFQAGTPEGFYDDIKIEDIEKEEEFERQKEEQKALKPIKSTDEQFVEEEDIVITQPKKTKPTKNYSQIYRDLQVPTFSYLHNIDPEQHYDVKDATWSIYPLLRLMSPIYFKSITIEPGYYLLTPREHKGKWFMLFKQNGIVKHIVPVYERDYTPEMFYDEHIPKPKLTGAQKIHMGFLDFIGNFKSTKRKAPIQTYLEVNDLENYFVSIVIYYGAHKYYTIFRTVKL